MSQPISRTAILSPVRSRRSLPARLLRLHSLWRSRQQLRTLEPHQLADVGLSENQAESEANRPIWDVPAHWLQ